MKEMSREHPRLFGSAEYLRELAARRPAEYARMKRSALGGIDEEFAAAASLSLVHAVEGDDACAARAVEMARAVMARPLKHGHETFAHEMAKVAVVWDHCLEHIPASDREAAVDWINREFDLNTDVEMHVLFNGYYGYKMWGFGLAGYATWPDNPRAREIIDFVREDVIRRAIPAQRFGGAGGGWPEGYYVHYFLYFWLLYCEAARRLEGVDYCAMVPEFYRERAIAEVHECYPGLSERGSRRMAAWGDCGGVRYNQERDSSLCARRILARRFYGEDPRMASVVGFNRATPSVGSEQRAYMDFLFSDLDLPARPVSELPPAHLESGAGCVIARSSWEDDATWVLFKSSRRCAGHQHLDAGHFAIWRRGILAADSGEYANYHDRHAINWYLRTVAHNCILVHDPAETWPSTRSRMSGANDGGQAYPWAGTPMAPNGSLLDMSVCEAQPELVEIASVAAFEDTPEYTYAVGDCTRAYSERKVRSCVRHLLFVRPEHVVVFDRVVSTDAAFGKAWLLHTFDEPASLGGQKRIEDGLYECQGAVLSAAWEGGVLDCATLLPERRRVLKIGGDGVKDYWYGGVQYEPPPNRHTDYAPHWRIEVSPAEPSEEDLFLHVLRAGLRDRKDPPLSARLIREPGMVGAEFATPSGTARVLFNVSGEPGGLFELDAPGGKVSRRLAASAPPGR